MTSLLYAQEQVTIANIVEYLRDRIGNLADGVNFDLFAVTQAIERLIARDIIQGSEAPGASRFYTFTAHLYYEWVSKYKSLGRIVPELVTRAG